MSRNREVKVVVLGEDRGGSRVLRNLQTEAGKVSPGMAGAQDALSKLVEVLVNQLPAGGEQARDALEGLSASMAGNLAEASAFKTATVTAAAAGGAAIVAFGVDAARTFVEVAGETRKVRGAMGGTAEDASRLRNIGKALGMDVDTLANGFVQFGKRLEDNRDYLRALGVEVARNRSGTTDQYQTLLRLGDAYKSIQDPVERNVFLTTVFGRTGAELRAIMSGTREEMERFAATGPILSDEDLKKARETKVEFELFRQQIEQLKVEVGGPVVSFASELADVLSRPLHESFLDLVRGSQSDRERAARAAAEHRIATEDEAKAAAEAAAELEKYNQSLRKLETTTERLAKAERDAAEAPAKAARAREDAARAIEDAERSLADARESAARSVVDANRRIEDSHRSLDDAHQREIDAQESLAEARRGAVKDLENLRAAQERNTLAEERAALGVDRARSDVGKAKTIAEEKDAKLSLREAELSLSDAQEKRREDAEALATAEANGIEGSRRVVDAKRSVQDAIRAVGDAERAVTDAMDAATRAQEQGARFVEAAQRSLADATRAAGDVARATLDEQIEKTRALRDATFEVAEARKAAAKAADEAVIPLKPGEHGPPIPRNLPGRAHGGPVRRGNLYVVGENQPELFAPGMDGTILPTTAGVGGSTYNVSINQTVQGNPDETTLWRMRQAGKQGAREAIDEINRGLTA